MADERDCENCIHRVPILDKEEDIWKGAYCDSWDCEFYSRKKAIEKLREIGEIK